jgi:hypothetical protein
MSIKAPLAAVVIAAVTLCATAVSAQSLGDLARKEEARRKAVKNPGKLYNQRKSASRSVLFDRRNRRRHRPATRDSRTRRRHRRRSLNRAISRPTIKRRTRSTGKIVSPRLARPWSGPRPFADSASERINALTADFSARSDPAQRAVIERDRQKALAELDRVNQEIKVQTKAITDAQEEARKAGVPAPGTGKRFSF